MAVRLPGPDDVQRARVQNTSEVIPVPVDPMGRVFDNLGQAGMAIAQRIGEQRDESDIVKAEIQATNRLDQLHREVLTSDTPPEQHEQVFSERARQVLNESAGTMSGNARRAWEARSAQLLNQGVLSAREGAQRRSVERERAGVIEVGSVAEQVLRDPNSSPEVRAAAMANFEVRLRRAGESGLLGADDIAIQRTRMQEINADIERTLGLRAQARAEADRIRTTARTYGERLALARNIENPAERELTEDMLTEDQSRDNAALDEVIGTVQQAYLNGEDYRALPEYRRMREEPIFADAHIAFRDLMRQDAARAAAGTSVSAQQSEAIGDYLEQVGAEDQGALMLIVDALTGRTRVGTRIGGRTSGRAPADNSFDLSETEFQRRTGLSVAAARAAWGNMNSDDRRRVLDRRNDASDTEAIDSAVTRVLNVAEPMAQAAGLPVSSEAEDNFQRRGQFRAYLRQRVRELVAQGGEQALTPDVIDQIARDAIVTGYRAKPEWWGGVSRQQQRAFEGSAEFAVPFDQIDQDAANQIVAALRRDNPGMNNAELRRRAEIEYGQMLARGQER